MYPGEVMELEGVVEDLQQVDFVFGGGLVADNGVDTSPTTDMVTGAVLGVTIADEPYKLMVGAFITACCPTGTLAACTNGT